MSKSGKIALAVLALVVAAIVAIVVVNTNKARQRERDYAEAKALYDAGEYEQASEIYAKLKDDAWLKNCDTGVAERDARALYDGGRPDEALALLRENAPESALRVELAEKYAAALIDAGDYEAALAALKADAPESENIPGCERIVAQVAEEEAFRKSALEGAWDDAGASVEKIAEMNAETGRLTDNQLESMECIAKGDYGSWCVAQGLLRTSDDAFVRPILAEVLAADGHYSNAFNEYQALGDEERARSMLAAMADAGEHGQWLFEAYQSLGDEDGMRAEAAWMLDSGKYEQAYAAYEALNDAGGMAKAMEADGDSAAAFRLAVKAGDVPKASALLDQMLQQDTSLVYEEGEGGLLYDSELRGLLDMGGDEALALARRMADGIVERCRALLAQKDNYLAWSALNGLRDSAESLWTEDWQALADSCVEPMPKESFVIRDRDAQAKPGDVGGTATISVYNESGRPLILSMFQLGGSGIWVYVSPGMYKFTVKAGSYMCSVWRGEQWFGDKNGFGPHYSSTDVEVVNGTTGLRLKDTDRLEGSYSLTVK